MNLIHWLRFIKTVKTNIDDHYILNVKENFMVFTLKTINDIKCSKIIDTNIKGENKPQYFAYNVHKIESILYKITQPNECNVYYGKNRKECFYTFLRVK